MPQEISSPLGGRGAALIGFHPVCIRGAAALRGSLWILAAIVVAGSGCEKHQVSHEVDNTRIALVNAKDAVAKYHLEHNALPTTVQGQLLIAGVHDGWGRLLRYTVTSDGADYDLRSAGLDGAFDTMDDIILEKLVEPAPATPVAPAGTTIPALNLADAFRFSLTAEGAMTIEGRPVSATELADQLQLWGRDHPGGTVLIDYPNATPSERILEAYTLCTQFKLVPTRAPIKMVPATLPAL